MIARSPTSRHSGQGGLSGAHCSVGPVCSSQPFRSSDGGIATSGCAPALADTTNADACNAVEKYPGDQSDAQQNPSCPQQKRVLDVPDGHECQSRRHDRHHGQRFATTTPVQLLVQVDRRDGNEERHDQQRNDAQPVETKPPSRQDPVAITPALRERKEEIKDRHHRRESEHQSEQSTRGRGRDLVSLRLVHSPRFARASLHGPAVGSDCAMSERLEEVAVDARSSTMNTAPNPFVRPSQAWRDAL